MKDLARQMGYDASYLSHVENGRYRPSREFIRRADHCLQAAGALLALHTQSSYAARLKQTPPTFEAHPSDESLGKSLIVQSEHAMLALSGDVYKCSVMRVLKNDTQMVVTELPVSVEVDRFPDDRDQSREHYRQNPLKLYALNFKATLDQADDEPLMFKVEEDRDSLKRLRVLFRSTTSRFPLYPGRTTTLRYSYEVPEPQYGSWFQREIRFPTNKLSVSIELPAPRTPWLHGSRLSTDGIRDLNPDRYDVDSDVLKYHFSTIDAPLTSQFFFEWRERSSAALGYNEKTSAA